MISIIISSYKDDFFKNISANIAETVGVEHEIIKVENKNKYGICEAYNIGASKSKFPYLVFCHEDIIFHTEDWGKTILKQFQENPSLGMLSSVGSKAKSKVASGWFLGYNQDYLKFNFIQSDSRKPENVQKEYHQLNRDEKVVCVDGFFLATKKSIWEEFKFDQKLLKGFHAYDLDFSLAVGQKYDIIVSSEMMIEHTSLGTPDLQWLLDNIKVSRKWENSLPRFATEISKIEKADFEFYAAKSLLYFCYVNKIPVSHLKEEIFSKRKLFTKSQFSKLFLYYHIIRSVQIFIK